MKKVIQIILSLLLLTSCQSYQNTPPPKTPINIDPYTINKINKITELNTNENPLNNSQSIEMISRYFLNTPYKANMLQGSELIPEKLVIDFRGMDCFTYLDYVTALRNAKTLNKFVDNLIITRYIDGDVSFFQRKHFFSDWAYREYKLADDITATLSADAINVEKTLNQKSNGEVYLPGIPIVKRNITYIPANKINQDVINQLQTGDLIGIYTNIAGLDVTHVGFFIMTNSGPVLRNASSRKVNEKVVDSPFMEYVSKIPGIIVFRLK